MTFVGVAGIASTVLAVCAEVPYIRSILNGKTKPHRLGWLVLTILNGMVFFAQFFAGGRKSTLVSLIFFIFSLLILGLSIKRGTSNTSKADRYLFIFAIIAIIAWGISRNNVLAIWLTLIIDVAATSMIILKIRELPDSEAPLPWAIGGFAFVFSCITLADVKPGILYVRPIYGLASQAAVTISVFYFRARKQK